MENDEKDVIQQLTVLSSTTSLTSLMREIIKEKVFNLYLNPYIILLNVKFDG